MSIFEKLRLLNEWSPVLGFGQRYIAESDPHKRAIIVGEAGEWLTSKTKNEIDDKYVGHLVAILKSPEGESFVRDLVADLESVSAAVEGAK